MEKNKLKAVDVVRVRTEPSDGGWFRFIGAYPWIVTSTFRPRWGTTPMVKIKNIPTFPDIYQLIPHRSDDTNNWPGEIYLELDPFLTEVYKSNEKK